MSNVGFALPNSPALGSATPAYELASDYIIRVIDRLQCDNLKSVCIKESAQTELNKWVQSRMPRMIFSSECKSWCKQINLPMSTASVC
jgi:hypothetical protein